MQSLRFTLFAMLLSMLLAANAQTAPTPETLAYVGEDTLTTIDLRIELNLMEKRSDTENRKVLPAADAVLRRLIQNRLIIQEGYRMGLNDDFTVKNQVTEAVNARCMGAILDSVALTVPKDSPDLQETRRKAVKKYIDDLMVVYNVQVDSTLLKSLDYGSNDPDMQTYLRDNNGVLATVPTGELKVSAFSRIIRFTAFHGLEGKPDAAERRDKIFHEWVAEAVTIHEARQQAIVNRPMIQLYKTRLERTLMLDETLKILLQLPGKPTDEDIQAYYQENSEQFLKPPHVKMKSLKFATEDAAKAARDRLVQGAKMKWIKRNMDQVVDGPAPFPEEWFEAGKLALSNEQAEVGYIPEPYGVPGGWVLARVSQVQEPAPFPLADCRDKILRMINAEITTAQMQNIITRLEEVVEVQIMPDAENKVAMILAELEETSATP